MEELTLVLNTVEKRVQFLLCQEGKLLCAEDWLAQRGGVEILAPALGEACTRLGRRPSNIRRIACAAGPGNFTGLRIGLATATGLAHANGAKQAGFDYLFCLALNANARHGEEILVLTNARRDLAYAARFMVKDDGVPCPLGKSFITPLPFLINKDNLGEPHLMLGSAVSSHRALLSKNFPFTQLLPPYFDNPSPVSLLAVERLINWNTGYVTDIEPLYLRDCDAVENFNAIVKTQGRTPELARSDLERLMHTKID